MRLAASLFVILTAAPNLIAQAELPPDAPSQAKTELLAHWPLQNDARDHSPHQRHGIVRGDVRWVDLESRSGARFDGRSGAIEVPARVAPQLGKGDFTITAWAYLPLELADVPGDILGQYDSQTRRGFQIAIKSNAGVTSNQPNLRQLQFGMDTNQQSEWLPVGRPGNATLAFALATYQGKLFAGTCDNRDAATGRVYELQEANQWIDRGSPDNANAVTAMAEYDGNLYAATGKYRFGGSSLAESTNQNVGGKVFRYEAPGRWIPCGKLESVEAIGGFVVFQGKLYASSLYRPAGFFRYEGSQAWTSLSTPGVRIEAMAVYNGHLYGTSYDAGHVFRFDGQEWQDCGPLGTPGENSQTYSFAIYQGRLYVGTWRSGKVYRFEEPGKWTDVGQLGQELEVMGMLVHNGRLTAGTLPLAEIYQYRGGRDWQRLAQLDHTGDVLYRRAWTMAEYDGDVYCSTLPSGVVFRYHCGVSAMHHSAFPTGWHHIAAIRNDDRLRLFIDAEPVATSRVIDPTDYDLQTNAPLLIGFGQNDFFCGVLSDVRMYRGALSKDTLTVLGRE